jgi:GT2 family glycosyltransferase
MKLSVIIVNYNVKYFLEQCLYSVRNAAGKTNCEIIVVDNNSVDGSIEMVKRLFPEVLLMANTENLGFSVANNQAMKIAKGEYVLLLNPDTVVEEDTFSKVVAFMDEHPDAGGLGVKMIDGKGNFLPESKRGLPTPQVAFFKIFGLARLFPRSRLFGKYHLGYLDKEEVHEIEVLSGAFMLMRKAALEKTGLLDETFFMYGEDIDLSYRITQAGYKNYYYPGTTILHYKGESTKKSSVNYVFVFYKAMIIFAKKHYSNRNAGMFSFLLHIAIYIRAAISLAHRLFLKIVYPLTDAVIIIAGMYFLKNYWEHTIKFVKGGQYPPDFMLYNVPAYTLLWILGVYFNGGYDKNVSAMKVVRGVLSGSIAIAVIYAFVSEEYRFSRALIILGAVLAMFAMVFYRSVIHLIRFGNLNMGEQLNNNTLIVGSPGEADRVLKILSKSRATNNIIGFVGMGDANENNDNYLGNIRQLKEITEIMGADEIIFCSKDISATSIIDWMTKIGSGKTQYKILPEDGMFIIGSNSKNTPGELYTIDINISLSKPTNLKKKRILDLCGAALLLLLSPAIIMFQKKPLHFLTNLLEVFAGNKSWVGYAPAKGSGRNLPPIKPGVLSPLDTQKRNLIGSKAAERLNMLYARDYSVDKDFGIILRNLRSLGN